MASRLKIYEACSEHANKNGLPDWPTFDRIAHSWITRLVWVVVYVVIYSLLVTAWWQFLFLPITLVMGSLQGAAVNWWGHLYFSAFSGFILVFSHGRNV